MDVLKERLEEVGVVVGCYAINSPCGCAQRVAGRGRCYSWMLCHKLTVWMCSKSGWKRAVL